MFKEFPPYIGLHLRDEAPGALPNGIRVQKTNSKSDDTHKDGEFATVLGSMGDSEIGYMYFVEWDSHPLYAVGLSGTRCKPA